MKALSRRDFRDHLRRALGFDPEVDISKPAPLSRAEAAAVPEKPLGARDLVHAMRDWPADKQAGRS